MNYVFIGMPGSGKGTQAEALAKKLNIPLLSAGNCFRKNIKNKTELGKKVEKIVDRGDLVPAKVTFEIMKNEIQDTDILKGLILDGYPRSILQAELLEEILNVDIALNIMITEDNVFLRIGGRRTCKCGATYHIKFKPPKKEGICDDCGKELFVRDDSTEETIKNRLKVYKESTIHLKEFYKDKIIEIDGNPLIPEVTKEIFEKLGIKE